MKVRLHGAFYTHHRGELLKNEVCVTRRNVTAMVAEGWSFRAFGPLRLGFRQIVAARGCDDGVDARGGRVVAGRIGAN